jgi:hypothetical protein
VQVLEQDSDRASIRQKLEQLADAPEQLVYGELFVGKADG